jgi:hypothetical protein
MYSLRGAVVAMIFVAGMGAYSAVTKSVNYDHAKASVVTIDRKCNITETTTGSDGRKTMRGTTDSCKSVDEWETVREKRTKVVSGTATIHVSYTAPKDGSSHYGELKFDGRDDEFYELKAGDEIDVLVSKSNPDVITKA